MNSLGRFSITPTESRAFARASGDFNPLHLDPVAARRTRFGQTLIHGICATVKALDLFLQHGHARVALSSIQVKFSRPVTQGQELEVLVATTGDSTRLELFAAGIRCQIIHVEFAEMPHTSDTHATALHASTDDAGACMEITIDACTGLSGAVELFWDQDLMHILFPSAVKVLPERQLATLLASTQIVGMRCPGLHSVFAQLNLRFNQRPVDEGSSNHSQLAYRTLSIDERIDRVELAVANAYAEGTIEAFFRAPPAQQATFRLIATRVSSDEFSAQYALVIGASRGLGEVITKVLAAGGASIMMTYAVGRDDATRIAAEIGQERTAPQVCPYDVLKGSPCAEMTRFFASVTHIYYLASPSIEKGDSTRWDRPLFDRYCDYYVDGLATLLQGVRQHGLRSSEIQLFIPSSIFLEQSVKGFNEYIAAKAAAESFAACITRANRNWRVHAPRLPRLHTDQTSSLRGPDEQNTLEVIIEQLRLAFGNAHQIS